MSHRVRVVVAATGSEGDSGIACMLRDAGAEVICAGCGQAPEQIAHTVVQEDADAVAVSGADSETRERIRGLLGEQGADDVEVIESERVTEWVRHGPRRDDRAG